MNKPKPLATKQAAVATANAAGLLTDLRQLIVQSRQAAAAAVNASLTLMYWRIGQRIRTEVLGGQRASYGAEIVATLSRQLVADYGRGFEEKSLRRMVQFAEQYPDEQIVVSLIRHLSWTHFLVLLPLKEPLARDFYAQMCSIERWSVRTLRERVDSMLFERTALSQRPEALIQLELDALRAEGDVTPPLVLKDPYVLDFLELGDRYLEKGLEDAILRELEHFLLELGAGFSFVARQRRIQLDSDDFYIDLLFYNRKLRRLVAIELKLGRFKAAHKGQMELYLKWLDRHERQPGEETPIGLILCAESSREQVELLQMHKDGITVAEYWTELPPKAELEQRLHAALVEARERLARRGVLLEGGEDE